MVVVVAAVAVPQRPRRHPRPRSTPSRSPNCPTSPCSRACSMNAWGTSASVSAISPVPPSAWKPSATSRAGASSAPTKRSAISASPRSRSRITSTPPHRRGSSRGSRRASKTGRWRSKPPASTRASSPPTHRPTIPTSPVKTPPSPWCAGSHHPPKTPSVRASRIRVLVKSSTPTCRRISTS